MTRWLSIAAYVLALFLAPASAAAADKSALVLGVFPYVSPVQLAAFHTRLKDYLAKSLQRPVTLVTAPDFDSFVERTQQGQYDLIITAPHLGRLAEIRDGYQRLAMTGHTVQGIFLAGKDSDIHKIEDLKGKSVMIAQRTSIIYQMSEQLLREKGLVPGESVTIIETRTHNNAMHAPLRAEADASVTGTLLWRVLGDEQKDKMRVIGTTPEAPGFLVMANGRLPQQEADAIKKRLLDYHHVPGSAPYFTETGYKSFRLIDDRIMTKLDPYIRLFLKPAGP